MKLLNGRVHTERRQLRKEMNSRGMLFSYHENMRYVLSKDQYSATLNDKFLALANAIRDRIIDRWITTQQRYHKQNLKRVYYLSLEFLTGRLFDNYAYNLGLEKPLADVAQYLGVDLDALRAEELDAGLGNGGLGRLAACFLDSMATLGIPAHGYGIRYDYGIFRQKIKDGYQVELPDEWLRNQNPWEFARPEYAVTVHFYGKARTARAGAGRVYFEWADTEDVLAVPYDYPVVGYKNNVVNTLRLWSARSTREFDLDYFNQGDYEQAVHKKILSENISKVLYPNDDISRGRQLRLRQEYFFVAASVADIIRRFQAENGDITRLADKVSIQLNDTHPALAIVELMRVLLDSYHLDWDRAWHICRGVFAYTNHTVMPEALEEWPVSIFEYLLPRHLQIIYEINGRFLKSVSHRWPGDTGRLREMSIIAEDGTKRVRMAHLAIVGSHSVNGVSCMHTRILTQKVFSNFSEFYPQLFNNKTNGITQRQWLLKSNPPLAGLISHTIKDRWVSELTELKKLASYKDDGVFIQKWGAVKRVNKERFIQFINHHAGVSLNPDSIFDVQIKRIHEYKRQLLFALYIISQYLLIKNDVSKFTYPRTFVVGGKAAPGYFMAKLIIKFINNVADIINHDEDMRGRLSVVFLENYSVSVAEKIIPAADLSEQISCAGTEASGTGNMKFMLNGALTIGTPDGANIEIAHQAGENNIFIFGNNAQEIEALRKKGYDPRDYINGSFFLKEIIRLIKINFFSPYRPGLFDAIAHSLSVEDKFFVCADFDSYCRAQEKVSGLYTDRKRWLKKSIINTAKSGIFSSDRTIREYAGDIWHVKYKT